MSEKFFPVIRWVARSLAALMAAFIAFMFVGNAATDGVGSLIELSFREGLMMAAFGVVFLGLILSWKREKLGGWLVVVGMALFYILDFAFSGTFPRGLFFPLIALPGLLFLVLGYRQKTT
jgi:hypothetical protein